MTTSNWYVLYKWSAKRYKKVVIYSIEVEEKFERKE